MKVIVISERYEYGQQTYLQDAPLDLPDDIAIEAQRNGEVIPELAAPLVLVTWAFPKDGRQFERGWIGRVAPQTADRMVERGLGVWWPEQPAPPPPDADFWAMPDNWNGGPLLEVIRTLIFTAPQVATFGGTSRFSVGVPTSLDDDMRVARWTMERWRDALASWSPMGKHRDSPVLNVIDRSLSNDSDRHSAIWRRFTLEIDRLLCIMFERLRTGEWVAMGVRDDLPEAPRKRLSPKVWAHPRYRLAWEGDETALRPDPGAPGQLPHYAQLVVSPANPVALRGTAAAETRCRAELAKLAEANPEKPPAPKPAICEQLMRKTGVSLRGFQRVWAGTVPDSWKDPGRHGKSKQHAS